MCATTIDFHFHTFRVHYIIFNSYDDIFIVVAVLSTLETIQHTEKKYFFKGERTSAAVAQLLCHNIIQSLRVIYYIELYHLD